MKRTMKLSLSVLALMLFLPINAIAGFRIARPSAAIKQQALMSIQSAGNVDEETVETTTKEKPFTVNLSELGVTDPTNAYLVLVNEKTGNAISISTTDEREQKIELPPLALAELEMQYLGANQKYRALMICTSPDNGKEEVVMSTLLASSQINGKRPNFNYRGKDGVVRRTADANRRLVSMVPVSPRPILSRDANESVQIAANKLALQKKDYAYVYELPNGDCMSYVALNGIDATSKMTRLSAGKSSNLQFDLYYSDKVGVSAESPTAEALKLWCKALKGTIPVQVYITMVSFSKEYGEDYQNIIGFSSPLPPYLYKQDDKAYVLAYPESLHQQLSGVDSSGEEQADIYIEMNTDMPFYYGTDGKCPSTKIDYETIVLHEVTHGLGFSDSIYEDGSFIWTDGTYYYPTPYDYYLYFNYDSGYRICDLNQYGRSLAITSDELYWDGPIATEANGGARIKMYAPAKYDSGSSVCHWDWGVSFDTFMKWAYTTPLHKIGERKLALLQDIGWSLADREVLPPPPEGLAATTDRVGEIVVSWMPSSGAESYDVLRSDALEGEYKVVKSDVVGVSCTETPPQNGVYYCYKVRAKNSQGSSALSSYALGKSLAPTTLTSVEVTGSATLTAGSYDDYKCIAHYSDDTQKDVTSSAEWTLPYGKSYATQKDNRVTAGSLTETKSATIHASYGGKEDELVITLLPKTVEVTFVPGTHGTLPVTKKTFTVDATYGELPVPTATDTYYDFDGWYTAENGGAKVSSDSKVAGSVTKLYAHWNYTHSLASLRLDAPEKVACGSQCQVKCYARYSDETEEALTKPTKFGVAVKGNELSSSQDGGVITIVAGANAYGSITVTAYLEDQKTSVTVTAYKPSVTVEFDAQGGSVSPASQSFTVGEAYGTLPVPTYTAYTFDGWFTAPKGGEKVTAETICQLSVTTLYARWVYNPTPVSLAIEGVSAMTSGGETTFICKVTYNDNTVLEVTPTWTASAGTISADGHFKAPGVMVSSSVTIDAAYGGLNAPPKTVTVNPETVTVSFDARGGQVSPSSKVYTVGAKYVDLPTATRDGNWKFVGWFTALDETGTQVDANTVVDKSVVTLYAFWQEIDVLTDIAIIGAATVTGGKTESYICRATYSNKKEKDVSADWSMASGSSYADISSSGVLSANATTVNRSVSIKASFGGKVVTKSVTVVPEKVTVAFNGNGGSVAMPSREYVVGAKYNEFPVAEQASHRFEGWFTDPVDGVRVLESAVVTRDITELFAHWQVNPPALKELTISGGKSSVVSGETVSFICTATFTNGITETSQDVTGVATWTVGNAAAGTVKAGTFEAAQVTVTTETTISAAYEGKSTFVDLTVTPDEVSVTFDPNGGSVSETSRKYVVGAAYGVLPMPEYAEHDFEGWYTDPSAGMLVTEATVCRKEVVALYARWKEQTKLTGIAIDGPASLVAGEEGQYVCIATYSDSTEKQVAPEWRLGDNTLGRIDENGLFCPAYVPCETNVELIATFGGKTTSEFVVVDPAYVSVYFDAQNGVVTPQRMEFVIGSPYGELPVPTRSKYDFAGWYTREAKGGELVSEQTLATNTVTTLYAGWNLVSSSLTGIKIEGVGKVTSGGGAVFTCKAQYADGTSGSVVPTWSIINGHDYASLTIGGYLTAEETDEERSVTIQAAYTEKGIRYEDQWVVTIVPATLVLDPGAISIEAEAQNCSLVVDAFDDWTISTDADWITLGKTSGSYYDTVTFAVTENTDSDERVATITVKCGAETATCTVKQYSPIPDTYVQVQFNPGVPDQAAYSRQYVLNRKFGYLPTPVRTGYAFGGWWTGANGTGTRVHALTVVSDDNQTLYGYWTGVTPSYALNGSLDCVADAVHPWGYDYTTSVDRKLSMVSAEIGNRESTSVSVLVEGKGRVSFYWRTSCEQYFDTLSFYVDGKFVANISGETGWETMAHEITTLGQHVLTWTYAKDGQGAAGADCGWLDVVSWIPSYTGMASIKSAGGNSLPEAWINAYGLEASATVPDEDLDGDGMTNYEEFLAGTDPTDPESKFTIDLEMGSDGIPSIRAIPDLGDSSERRYILEGKTNLNDVKWAEADETIHRFFRVRIETK